MNGDTAGLESTNSRRPRNFGRSRETLSILIDASTSLEGLGEYKAAREVQDAAIRLQSQLVKDEREARERKRSGEALDGQDPQNAEVIASG